MTVDNSAPPPATIAIDRLVVRHAKGTLASPALTTPTAGDAVLAFVAFDGPNAAAAQSATVTGAGLTWTLVKRSNTQAGDVGDLEREGRRDAHATRPLPRRRCARATTGR